MERIRTMNDMKDKNKSEKALYEKPIAKVETFGHIELAPRVSEVMGWKPWTELMGSKVDGLLILQQFRPRCCICGSIQQIKEVRDMFLCQGCIDEAEKKSYYSNVRKISDDM